MGVQRKKVRTCKALLRAIHVEFSIEVSQDPSDA
jgi:hypothetical protein